MILGKINEYFEAVVQLNLLGADGSGKGIFAIIDTGFSGSLVIPNSMIGDLGLQQCGQTSMFLADGSMRLLNIYSVPVQWDGTMRNLFAVVLGDECLVGMQFFVGYELRIKAKPGGQVESKS